MVTDDQIVDQPTLLIVSDSAEFSRTVMDRWLTERWVPAFTLMTGDLCHDLNPETFQLAIVGEVRTGLLPSVFRALDAAARPVLFASDEQQSVQAIREAQPRVMILQQHEGWLDAMILVSNEAVRRVQALSRAARAEQAGLL